MGKKLIIILLSLSILFVFLTVILYFFKFGSSSFSNQSNDWVNFANYFSGILNPILTLLNLIIFAYLSFKLVKIEDDRNNWTLQELARPFGNLLLENTNESFQIIIHNVGLGPMILKDFKIFDDKENVYENFYDLINVIADKVDPDHNFHPKIDAFELKSESGAIAKDQSHCILKIYFIDTHVSYKEFIRLILRELRNYTVSITYNDMYGRQIECMKEKLFFASWNFGSA